MALGGADWAVARPAALCADASELKAARDAADSLEPEVKLGTSVVELTTARQTASVPKQYSSSTAQTCCNSFTHLGAFNSIQHSQHHPSNLAAMALLLYRHEKISTTHALCTVHRYKGQAADIRYLECPWLVLLRSFIGLPRNASADLGVSLNVLVGTLTRNPPSGPRQDNGKVPAAPVLGTYCSPLSILFVRASARSSYSPLIACSAGALPPSFAWRHARLGGSLDATEEWNSASPATGPRNLA
ncbi:hypothetical protein M441DRAFT_47288 [Trichoderma asperellum CBS 433.97]|uniref:Uncharacterized protein n=1 Tax=Trichoderma asperellum (strain ATCC 204424 / CBS 433.97 / NBRC 101777) TaxID=1042311 RepID=A0A2T3Z7K2_TRIA4|nr:hypothetical protein M441DRAFT_47288 [Trichoderma asperellum CBS 433.97]PTB40776.1 hypothetical protein M441DRAFT_47288 [Trichoderma asperellum CBS 433.97]